MTSRLLAVAVALALWAAPASAQLSKDSKILAPFKPVVAKASESTVRIKCDDKDAILGTIVDPNGLIVTKFSELRGTLFVRLPDGTEYEATTVASHREADLAIIKVDVKGLKAVTFTDTTKLPRGHWLAASGPTSDPIGVGIVSVMTRKLTGPDTFIVNANPNRGVMGIFPADGKDDDGNLGARIDSLSSDGPAAKAGMLAGDLIVEIDGKKVTSQETLRACLETRKSGDVVAVKAKRKGEDKAFKITLGKADSSLSRGDFQNAMGSDKAKLSDRRTGFPLVLQTDMVVDAKDCGGPVVDLEGNVLGINIARAGRVETWILPSEVIQPYLAAFKAGELTTTKTAAPAPARPVAPAPHSKGS